MSSAVKSKAQCEKLFLSKIRKQYNDTKNFDNVMIAGHAMDFKNQQHVDTFEELLESWEEYRDDNGAEEDNLDEDSQELPHLPELTKQRTTDDPETVESLILERHIYEMLYNILLASHYQMKKRKTKLLNELYDQVTVKQHKKKRSEIIAKWLPINHKTMDNVIKHIYTEIVQKHYHKSKVFTELKKQCIIQYIKEACTLSFEMLIAKNELSFFPLLFTDQSSSYIAPVVRYDKIIKKNEKKNQSLDTSSFLQIIKGNKAERGYVEGRHQRSYSSIRATQILYYTFPGVIVTDKNKVLEKADVFTHDDPSIFLRHDLNWIFTDKYFRERKMTKYKKDKSVELEDEDQGDNIFASAHDDHDPYHEIASIVPKMGMGMTEVKENNDILKNRDFIGRAQLIQDWGMLKRQKVDQLCEELCELIMESMEEEEAEEDEDDDDSKAEDDDDDEGEDEEYECNKVASKLLYDLIMKSREGMKLKMQRSHLNDKENVSYLNMTKLYKHFSNNQCKMENNTEQKVDIKHGYIVKRIVNSVFEAVIDDKDKGYTKYEFLKTNAKINQKLHEFIAMSCELICNIFHHEWDLCPVDVTGNKSLITFDDRIHIKDGNLSMEDSQSKIDYCSFPGIIAKSCWNQFDSQMSKNQIDEDQINKVLKYRMWACLNDEK